VVDVVPVFLDKVELLPSVTCLVVDVVPMFLDKVELLSSVSRV
jgi:hypothetical protein